jgi:hypothetical protein
MTLRVIFCRSTKSRFPEKQSHSQRQDAKMPRRSVLRQIVTRERDGYCSNHAPRDFLPNYQVALS